MERVLPGSEEKILIDHLALKSTREEPMEKIPQNSHQLILRRQPPPLRMTSWGSLAKAF